MWFKSFLFEGFKERWGKGLLNDYLLPFLALKEAKNTLVKNCIGKKVLINIKHKISMEQTIFLANKCQFVCAKLVILGDIKAYMCVLSKLQL